MDFSAIWLFIAPGILFLILWYVFQRYRLARLSASPPPKYIEFIIAIVIAGVAGGIFFKLLNWNGIALFVMSALGVLARWYEDWSETGTRPDIVKPTLATFLVYGVIVTLLLQPAPVAVDAASVPETIYGMSASSLQFVGLLITALENGYVWKTLIKD
jgi:hypothetical protein